MKTYDVALEIVHKFKHITSDIDVRFGTVAQHFQVLFTEFDHAQAILLKQSVIDTLVSRKIADGTDESLIPILIQLLNTAETVKCNLSGIPSQYCEDCGVLVHVIHNETDAVAQLNHSLGKS